MTPAEQARAFAAMALCGGALGVGYDALGVLRRGAAATAMADLIFGIACAAGVILTALLLECEAFRLYTLLGMASGLALQQATLGALGRSLTKGIQRLIKKV